MRAYIVAGLKHYNKALTLADELRREVGLDVRVLLSPGLEGVVVNGLYIPPFMVDEETITESLLVMLLAENPVENLILSCCA